MKAVIIYESVHHGNTKKLAEAMAEALGAKAIPSKEAKPGDLEGCDLVGFGSGIVAGKPYGGIMGFAGRLPGMKGRKAFVFSTCASGDAKYMQALRQKTLEKGFGIAGEFCCKGEFGQMRLPFWTIKFPKTENPGRPDAKDLEDAKEFAKGLLKSR